MGDGVRLTRIETKIDAMGERLCDKIDTLRSDLNEQTTKCEGRISCCERDIDWFRKILWRGAVPLALIAITGSGIAVKVAKDNGQSNKAAQVETAAPTEESHEADTHTPQGAQEAEAGAERP